MLGRASVVRRKFFFNSDIRYHNVNPLVIQRYAHSRSRKPDRRPTEPPVLSESYLDRANPEKGPVKNRTWAPASSSPLTTGNPKRSATSNPPRPQPPEAPRIRTNGQQAEQKASFSTSCLRQLPSGDDAKPPLQDSKQAEAQTSAKGAPQEQPESSNKAEDSFQESSQQQPLPDLRQGIPSTFDQEISGRSSDPKERDLEHTSLNLTENVTRDEQEQAGFRGDGRREAYKSSIDRRRETVAFYGFLTGGAMLLATVLTLGQSWDEREARGHPDIPNGWTPAAVYGRARTRLSEMLGYYTEPAFPQLLPHVDPAYKQPYTLVLSLEDLLVSSKWSREDGWKVAKRPGLDYFIRYLSNYYELVLFTSVASMNGQPVYTKLDPYHFIMFPLFREATRYMNGQHVKDLSYLNRDLSKTIIIDTDPNHTQLQPENAVILPKWDGEARGGHADDLIALIPFLEYIAGMSIEDVRKVIKSFEGTDIPKEYARREALMREAFEKEREKERRSKGGASSPAGGLSSMLGFKQGPQPGQLPGEQSFTEGQAQGKMLIDLVRERGRLQWEQLEQQIRLNGKMWLEEQEREEKKMMDEQMKSMKDDWMAWPTKMFKVDAGDKQGEEKK